MYIISSHRAAEWHYWCGEKEEGSRGSETSHLVLGVSNQGNYIQSNADCFPFAGACEQAAFLPQPILL